MIYSFDRIIGNELIKKTLMKSVLEDKLSHAYLFEGAEGSGKSLLANSFVRLIFCKTKADGCSCHSCVQFEAGSHSDLFYVQRGEKSKSIGVELIRTGVLNELHKKPFEYNHKVFIIEEAELMTPEAQNALLRSIEEPPEYAVFILLSNNINTLLTTVLSRCFIYKIMPFGNSKVYKYLESLGLSDEKATAACVYSGGSIGKALRLRENDVFFEMRNRINNALFNANHDLSELFSEFRELEEFKGQADLLLNIALIWYRDVLAYKATNDKGAVFQTDCLQQIESCSKLYSFNSLYFGVKSLLELKKSLAANTPFSVAFDAFAIKINDGIAG